MKKLSLLSFLAAAPAFAHEGHVAAEAEGNWHWLTEADHLVVLVLAVALVAVMVMPKGRALLRRLAGSEES